MVDVYPYLRKLCQKLDHEFQIVGIHYYYFMDCDCCDGRDMRWGVRDEATEDHMTSHLCMTELKKCQVSLQFEFLFA
jgi:hypothetical protein